MGNILNKFSQIKALVFDVDGVFTDTQMLITEHGELLRQMNTRDGYAVKQAIKAKLGLCVITGGSSMGIVKRLKGLGLTDVFYGIEYKLPVLEKWMSDHSYRYEDILYMGDDLPDIEVMRRVGLACCPEDAVPEIREISAYISPFKGGHFCVRDVIEKTMRAQGIWTTDAFGITD